MPVRARSPTNAGALAVIPESIVRIRAALGRTRALADQLVGLGLHEANELAARSGCQVREVTRDGKGVPMTTDLRENRINIATEGRIVVRASAG